MRSGDLVKTGKTNAIGIVVDIFGDLNPEDPCVRVLFTHPQQTYRWCKMSSLTVVKGEEGDTMVLPLQGALTTSGSL